MKIKIIPRLSFAAIIIIVFIFVINLSIAETLRPSIMPQADKEAIIQIEQPKTGENQNENAKKEITIQPIPDIPAPEFRYIQLKTNQSVQGNTVIKGQIKNAEKIEFYIAKTNSPDMLLYLGTANPKNEICEVQWDTAQNPNGQYYLFSKIFNESKEFTGPKILIEILNPAPKSEEGKKINEETAQKVEIIENETQQNKEETIKQKTEEINQETKIGLSVISNDIKKLDKKIEETSNQQISIQIMKKTEAPPALIAQETKKLEKLNQEKEKVKQEVIQNLSKKSEEKKSAEQKTAATNFQSKTTPFPAASKEETKMIITRQIDSLEKSLQKEEERKQEKIGELSNNDSDQDGLPDIEEARLKTNPNNPDSDGDGYLDGDEIKNGYDPLNPSQGNKNDKILFENPKETGSKKPEIYKTTKIEKVELENKEMGIRFEGKALPFSFITLYIYSEKPIIVTIKTDADGNWNYVLDKMLEDGQHEIYVTVTDNLGKITAKSEPLLFAKIAQAVTVSNQEKPLQTAQSIIEKTKRNYTVIGLSLVIAAMLLAIIIVGFVVSRKNSPPNSPPLN